MTYYVVERGAFKKILKVIELWKQGILDWGDVIYCIADRVNVYGGPTNFGWDMEYLREHGRLKYMGEDRIVIETPLKPIVIEPVDRKIKGVFYGLHNLP